MFSFIRGDAVRLRRDIRAIPYNSLGSAECTNSWRLGPSDSGIIEGVSRDIYSDGSECWRVKIRRATWDRARYFRLPLSALYPCDRERAAEYDVYTNRNFPRGEAPAPKALERTPQGIALTPGWYGVIGYNKRDMTRMPALHEHEFALKSQAEDVARLKAERDPDWHYIVFKTEARVSPYVPPQLPKFEVHKA